MEADLLNADVVADVIREQRETGELFGDILLAKGLVTEMDIAQAIVTQFHLPFLFLRKIEINEELKGMFPEGILRKYQFAPFDKIGRILLIATAGAMGADVLEELEDVSGLSIRIFITTISEVRATIDDNFIEESSMNEMGKLLGLENL